MNKFTSLFQALTVALVLQSAPRLFAQESHIAILVNTTNSRLNYGDANTSVSDFKKDIRGLRIGLSWQAAVTERFSIVPEIYFLRKGGTLKVGNPLNGIESSLKLNALEIPVLARVHLGKLYLNAGPYVSYLLSGTESSVNEGSRSISFERGANTFRKWEVGVLAGAGYQFSLKKKKLALELRYSHGLSSIHHTEQLYNRTLSISVSLIKVLKPRGR